MNSLLLLFNHTLTADQELDARASLGVSRIVEPPDAVRVLWADVPPDLPGLDTLLAPVRLWLQTEGIKGDYVLIQGDFGATYLMVRFALELELIPVYATTRRSADEEVQPDGTIQLIHLSLIHI